MKLNLHKHDDQSDTVLSSKNNAFPLKPKFIRLFLMLNLLVSILLHSADSRKHHRHLPYDSAYISNKDELYNKVNSCGKAFVIFFQRWNQPSIQAVNKGQDLAKKRGFCILKIDSDMNDLGDEFNFDAFPTMLAMSKGGQILMKRQGGSFSNVQMIASYLK